MCIRDRLYTDEANDKHKRLFDIYGGFSPAEPEEFMPVLYAYPFLNPYPHVNTVTMSELITTSSAYIINGDSPMTSVANTVAMTTFAVHTLHPYFLHATSTPRLPQYGMPTVLCV